MFQSFCGVNAAKNVVFVTTMWDNPCVDAINVEREKLHKERIAELADHGAAVTRFLNTSTSAREIIESLLHTDHHSSVVCQFAEELATGRLLKDTTAVQSLS